MLSSRLRGIRESDRQVYLQFLPQELTTLEVVQIIFVFVTRQILSLLGFGNKFEIKRIGTNHEETYILPNLRVSMPFKVKRHDLARYANAIGSSDVNADAVFGSAGQLCLLLSAFTEPAFLLLLAHSKSPIRPLGSINVRNHFELLRPDLCSAELLIGHGGFAIQAKLLSGTRKVKHGLEIDIEVDLVQVDGSEVVFKQIFTMLQFMKLELVSKVLKPVPMEDEWVPDEERLTISTESSRTMAWASICKDYNPIHVSDLAAKAFGFPRRIVHGNHALALALCAIEKEKARSQSSQLAKCSMSVRFIRPVTIPSTLAVASLSKKSETVFRLLKNDKITMIGSITT